MGNTCCRRVPFASFMIALVLLFSTGLALAHHPGEQLDELMGSKEKYFQLIDREAPGFTLQDAEGRKFALADMRDKIVVLHFIYAGCPDICPLHAERIAEVQEMIAQTPMKDRVRFVTITTDPENDTPQVLKDYGQQHGLKAGNWIFLTKLAEQPEDVTRRLAEQFGHKFLKTDDGYQTHSIVTHVIDRNGRWAANFHGLKFAPLKMVLYLNGLTNKSKTPEKPNSTSLWEQFQKLF